LPLAEKEAQAGKLAYEGINNTLLEELPQLVDMRVPYLDPSFDSVVKLQMRLASEGYSHMAGVQEYLPKSTRDEYSEGKMDERVEEVLQEVRNLSICGSTI
jgi:bridging integrator 3